MKTTIRNSESQNANPLIFRKPVRLASTLTSVLLLWNGTAHSSVILQDTFSYPDGKVTAVSGGLWRAHNQPGNEPITVRSNQLKVDFWLSEDVSITLPGAPYDTTNNPAVGNLYSSFTLRCTKLPTQPTGTCFAHFKNAGRLFRCRIFALTNNAALGTYRLAISSTNTSGLGAVQYPMNLTTNTTYTVVTRLNLATGASTLWINPFSETSSAATNTPPNVPQPIPIAAYAFRQARRQSGVMWVDNLKVATRFSDLIGTNSGPFISSVLAQTTFRNVPIGPIPFTVSSDYFSPLALSVTAFSSNTTVVSNNPASLSLSGTNNNRFLTITPATNAQGAALISLTVTDGANTNRTSFSLTVGAPTISQIPDQLTVTNKGLTNLPFVVFDAESNSVTLLKSSSNTNLLRTNDILFGGSGSNRTVTLTPRTNQSGVTVISIGVTDGVTTNSMSFRLGVSPRVGLLFSETFSYTNAQAYSNALTAVPGSPWRTASGIPLGIKLTNNATRLSFYDTEDAGATIPGGPYSPSNAFTLYAGFTVNFSILPFTNGNYFFMFKNSDTNVLHFRAKVYARAVDETNGLFRLGVANFEDAPADFPMNLKLNTPYQVVVCHNAGLGESALWVNPTSEQSPQVLAADVPRAVTIRAIGLRQNEGMGALTIGPIKVGTAFNDVFAIPHESLGIRPQGNNIVLTWSNSLFGLESSTNLPTFGPRITGATSPWTNPATGGRRFFRLVYP